MSKGNKSSKSGKSSAPAEEVYLCVTVAVSGRCPANGNILSLAAVACTKQRKILGLYSCNMAPLSGGERLSQKDVLGFWQSKPRELEEVCASPMLPPTTALLGLQAFCKPFGRCSLVGSPLLSCYGWLAHYWNVLLPGVAMPWGFSGICARSFASGLLGVPMQSLAQHPVFLAAQPAGLVTNGVPANDGVIAACVFTQMLRLSLKLDTEQAADGCAAPGAVSAVSNNHHGMLEITYLDDNVRAAVEAATKPLETSVERYPVTAAAAAAHAFQEYPSITDPSIDPSFVERATALSNTANNTTTSLHQSESVEWVVTEKVHGSNFSFICKSGDASDRTAIVCGKRTSVLSIDDVVGFFQFDRLLTSERAKLAQCYTMVQALLQNSSNSNDQQQHRASTADEKAQLIVAVVGELAGGEYVHPQVPLDLRGTRVQNGIQYHPNNFFYAFDLAYTWKRPHQQQGDGDHWFFLPFDDAQTIFNATNLLCAAPLFRGAVHDALAFNPVLQSTIPSRFGLPLIPENYAEGVVARPVRDLLLPDGSRLMAKLKHPKFSEFSHVSSDCTPLELLVTFSKNMNRVESVKSKLTESDRVNQKLVAVNTVADALADVRKLHSTFDCPQDQLAVIEADVLQFVQQC